MGYRIVYGDEPIAQKKSHVRLLTTVFLLVFVTFVRLAWPAGTECLRRVFEPGGETVQAFSQMVENVGAGQGFGEAVTGFCRTVISNGMA